MSFIRKIKRDGKIYLAEVENKWVDGKCVQRHIRYVGREADGKTILATSMSDTVIDHVKVHGPLLVLNFIANEIGLLTHLGKYGNEVLSMVFAHCLDYKSINQMPQWFERTDLNMILNIDGLTERRLLNALDSLQELDLAALQRNIFHAVKAKYRLKHSGVIYDVTNTYLYGKKCKIGHDKEGVKGRPLIQIGLGVTKDEGIPVFHKVFDGNTGDSRTLRDLITSFEQYHVQKGIFIYDRGVTSGRNLNDVRAMKWDTLCGISINEKLKKLLRPIIAKSKVVQLSNRVRLNHTLFYVTSIPYSIDGVTGKLAFCFNQQKQNNLRESRNDEILHAQELLNRGKRIKHGLERFFKGTTIIPTTLAEVEEFDGYSCIFSTQQIPNDTLVHLYFDKDLVEKAFQSLKGITHLRPIRHWLYQRVIAHVFICYLSYLLLSLLKQYLKPIGISANEALKELATMYKVYLRDSKNIFKISRVVALSKKQEMILKTINKKLLAA